MNFEGYGMSSKVQQAGKHQSAARLQGEKFPNAAALPAGKGKAGSKVWELIWSVSWMDDGWTPPLGLTETLPF